jgi:hypothetical protein
MSDGDVMIKRGRRNPFEPPTTSDPFDPFFVALRPSLAPSLQAPRFCLKTLA